MFGPVIRRDGKVLMVAPGEILYFEPMDPLPEEEGLAPDGKPWPSCRIQFKGFEGEAIHVKGTPEMILNSWFGRADNAPAPDPPRVVIPHAFVKVPPGRPQ